MAASPVVAIGWPKEEYLMALMQAGATPRVLDPATDRLPGALDGCSGVLLTGGADVEPFHYGEAHTHPATCTEPARDTYELTLVREAMARGLPILAICRGAQLLNVANGGTLFQDLPSQRPSSITHRVKEPVDEPVHTVAVTPGSHLASLLGAAAATALPVNSRHHQAIKTVAPGFLTVATAPDGVVEGIEKPGDTFCVGVQWHPENFWKTGRFSTLFDGFVAAARAYEPE